MNNILQLRYAVEVAKTGSISRAAQALYMSQPNLSKAIRELETDLGMPIFVRSAQGVTPTERGGEFLSYAENILSQIAEMEALYKPAPDKKVRFDICVPRASYISYAFTECIKALGEDGDIGVNYRETNSMRAIRCVAEGSSNIAVVRYQKIYEPYFLSAISERELASEPIWSFSCLALMSSRHPLASEPELDYPSLQKYTEIIHGDLSVPALPLSEARQLQQANEKKRTIAVYERGSQFELLSRIPTTYMWVSPMPPDVLDCFSLVQKRCTASRNTYCDILIRRKDSRMSAVDALFMEKLHESVRMVSEHAGLNQP